MKFLVCLIISCSYAFGTSFSDPSKSFGPAVIVEIKHTHELESSHHHHDVHEDDHHHEENKDPNDESGDQEQSAPHSHKVSISMSNSCVMTFSKIHSFKTAKKIESVCFSIYNELRPKNPLLGSIFRPPIS